MASGKRILVIGGGGREHALCWKLAQSEDVEAIICAPGNGGTAGEAKTRNAAIAVSDFEALIQLAQEESIDLTVVGPDNPLADGIVDAFEAKGLRVFGPCQSAARLESSKVFSKTFMRDHNLPTAPFEVFSSMTEAFDFCADNRWARVIKVDGLALGKGVYVCDTLKDCEEALYEIFEERRFGASGAQVIIESRMYGPEVSLMMLCDGRTLMPLLTAQDYKRRYEGNTGPNTGGMGCYAPVPLYEAFEPMVQSAIIEPLQNALREADFTFKGVLYAGLMMYHNKPYLLEFNARFGDPETQTIMPLLKSDLLPLLEACVDGTLHEQQAVWHDMTAVNVVVCVDTYPAGGASGQPITLPQTLHAGQVVFHAGTQLMQGASLEAHGGRVMSAVGTAPDFSQAAHRAYTLAEQIRFEGAAYRTDIAKDISVCHLK